MAMTMRVRTLLLLIGGVVALAAVLPSPAQADERRPVVIGHRGASGYLPEHTLEAYALAIELGADYIEPDLVMTRDGHLITRHEPNIANTTDVRDHPEFASRRRVAVVDGFPEEGWFASDFTLAEIRTLRAVQAFRERPQEANGLFRVPTFAEVIDFAKRKSAEKGRVIGLYPETKHPTYHRNLGLPLEPALVRALQPAGWDRRDAPVFIQSFEQQNLRTLRGMTRIRLVQLVDANDVKPDGTLDFTPPYDRPYDWTVSGDPALLARRFDYFTTDPGLREISTYADVIAPWKRYIVSTEATDLNGDGAIGDENGDGAVNEADRSLLPPTDLIARAHAAGLLVHTWAFRNEAQRLPADYLGNPVKEYDQFYALGIDGVFTDFADTAIAARAVFDVTRDPAAARCLVDRRDCKR
jgi:glycerophosphoryl diester phosphodiesterase